MSLKNAVRRFFPPRMESPDLPAEKMPTTADPRPARDTGAESPEARHAIRQYLEAQRANVDRALRLKDRVERLEDEGTPSESARNKAERARQEVLSGLATLRSEFVDSQKDETAAGQAFDREVERVCPDFNPPDTTSARPF